jgi:hypothetical protein
VSDQREVSENGSLPLEGIVQTDCDQWPNNQKKPQNFRPKESTGQYGRED